ncbi:hypothetical protein L7F22_020597 [Adiantum nelumboides]|nr:hypothetical protein [Adiantum nelumboides]
MGIETDEMGPAYTSSMAAPGHEVAVMPLIGKLRLHIQGYVGHVEFIMPLEGYKDETESSNLSSLDVSRRAILDEYADCFSEALPGQLFPERSEDHNIDLVPGSAAPNKPLYRVSAAQQEEIMTQKDGSWRMCIDYRALNKITVKNKFPIPRIDDVLDCLQGSSFFKRIDLKSDYHQIQVNPADVPKTAFKTNFRLYEFLVMPFGLTNAPATFNRMMDIIFRPLRHFVGTFCDDMIVFSKSEVEHMEHLRAVFEMLRKKRLVVNWKKRVFHGGDSPLWAHCFETWRFIRFFAEIVAPLHDLMRKGVVFRFGQRQHQAFRREADWKFVALRELLDAFDNLVMQATQEAEVEECRPIAEDIQTLLVDTCYELKKQGLSFGPFLELLRRLVEVQKSLQLTLLWRSKILNLALLLSMTTATEEQIILIGLARKVLRENNEEDMGTFYRPGWFGDITEKLNDVSFRLRLPDTWKIHNAFHVSLLKPFRGDVPDDGEPDEQPEVEENEEILVPEQILAHKDMKTKGVDVLIDSSHAFPLTLLWVYPTVNVMATSCSILKESAVGLLQDVENLLVLNWCQNLKVPDIQFPDVAMVSSYGQLAHNMHTVLLMLWFNIDSWKTWKSIVSIGEWLHDNKNDNGAWITRLAHYVKGNVQNCSKSSDLSPTIPLEKSELILWVCMLVSVLLIHPECNSFATKAIVELGKNDPVVSLSLVPVVLFYLKALKRCWKEAEPEHLFRLIKLLPSLALHPMSSSIVAGMLQSLLHSDGVLPGMAIRLLCKTWETADKVYPHLQVQLDLPQFQGPISNFETHLGRAASLKNVCKLDADRGVEMILSVQACIESGSVTVKALGLESLAWLCQHDVIDFYTAWDVLSTSFPELPANSMLAKSLCGLLQNGALDAAAYPGLSCTIVQLLWTAATLPESQLSNSDSWMVQEKALNALTSFEVDDLIRCLGELTGSHVQILLSLNGTKLLTACESLVVKFLYHEFKFRQRAKENVKHLDNKVGKLIDAIPRVLSTSVQRVTSLYQSPAAFILLRGHRASEVSQNNTKNISKDWEIEFEQQFIEMADSSDLHGNLICALLYLDLWYYFLIERLKEKDTLRAPINDVALQFMKVLYKVSREAIPRVAENATLALAALYQIMASEASLAATLDSLHESIVSYLKSCLAQNSHEYLQWTSAAALGHVARYCNKSDWRFKMDVLSSLMECLSQTDRDIVRGACSMGLGLFYHNLFTHDNVDTDVYKKGMVQQKELSIHDCIFQRVVKLLLTWYPEMRELLQSLSSYTTVNSVNTSPEVLLALPSIKPLNKSEESVWTVAGLAMALGSSVIAFENAGSLECLTYITKCLLQGIQLARTKSGSKDCFYSFALGAYVTLPLCIGACLHLELLTKELDNVILDANDFLTTGQYSKLHSTDLSLAACVGSGNLLATFLNHGTFKVPRHIIFSLIESLKAIVVDGDSELASLGGCIGLANALGAGAALLVPYRGYRIDELRSMPRINGGMESSSVCTPLLYESSCKTYVQNLLQDLLNYGLQGSDRIKSHAWWSLALVRRSFMNSGNPGCNKASTLDVKSSRISLNGLAKDSSLFFLCSWLLSVTENLAESSFPCQSVASVLRCLKQAPQLPNLDWRTLLRQLLHIVTSSKECEIGKCQSVAMQDDVCKECVLLSLAHAPKLSVLQAFLDELCDFPRLISIRPSMASVLMLHMTELSSIFSRSRMEKFFFACIEVACRTNESQGSESLYSADSWQDLRISFWKGFKSLLLQSKEGLIPGIDKDKLFSGAEKCLYLLDIPLKKKENKQCKIEEWSEVLKCLVLASDEWIAKITELDVERSVPTMQVVASAQKAIFLRSQMVARHRFQPSALEKPVKWLHNLAAADAFQQLLWVACALTDVTIQEKQGWLMDTLETVFSLKNPETAVVFLALLVSSWCCLAPLILVDSRTTMQLLPFTLSSLLSSENWRSTSKLLLQRSVTLFSNVSDSSLTAYGSPLWYVKRACAMLRKNLPFVDQLKLLDDLATVSSIKDVQRKPL